MDFFENYSRDIARYTKYSNGSVLLQILTQQGLWALFQYRISSLIFCSNLFSPLKRSLLYLCVISQKLVEMITGISIPYSCKIGPGLYIGHFGNIIVNGNAVIGSNCNISQGVTIGVSGRGVNRGVPIIGDRVYIGVNAVVAGKIVVGDAAVIGSNSLVNRDVPPNCTVLGVPAVVVSQRGSAALLAPESGDL